MTELFIVDTNVLIAGLISSKKDSPVTRIVDSMLNGTIIYSLSSALLQEYRDVLLRPKLKKLHKLSEKEVDLFLTEIIANAVFHEPPIGKEQAPDSGDNHLWDLLQYRKESILITGDLLLIEKPLKEALVISPAVYWKRKAVNSNVMPLPVIIRVDVVG